MTSIPALLLILSLLLPGAASVTSMQAQATPPATPVASDGYAHADWLVDGAQLQAMLAADPAVKVVALSPPDQFAAGHIPGAAQVDWPDLEIVETSDQQVETWRAAVEQTLTALGLSPADTVVVYDPGTLYAPRLWWILDQLGHAKKAILNGGLDAWTAAGGELETGPSRVQPAPRPYVGTPNDAAIAKLAEVERALDDPNVVLVDARTPAEYAAGHIPGAINIEFTQNAEPNPPKVWKSAAELRELYEAAGVTPEKTVIAYCSTGVRSAATYFTLRLLGYERVRLFTGSFQEWSSHPELPVTTGGQP